jgi:hypothetical protein
MPFRALARHSPQFLYGERHVLLYRGGGLAERVVLYTCRDSSAFARKSASYADSLAPDFLLEDVSNGMREGCVPMPTAGRCFIAGNGSIPKGPAPCR